MLDEVALYYPYVEPPAEWIKTSLLLFDRLSSIAPRDPELYRSETTLQLQGDGLWEPSYADHAGSLGAEYLPDLENVLYDYAGEPEYQVRADQWSAHSITRIYLGKLDQFVADLLVDMELSDQVTGWGLQVHEEVAAMVLAVTARHLVARANFYDRDGIRMVTSTDLPLSRVHAYDPVMRTVDRQRCTELILNNLIPIPGPEVSIEEVVDFRTRHTDELSQMRIELDRLIDAVERSPDPQDAIMRMRRDVTAAVEQVEHAARSRNLRLTAAGTLSGMIAGAAYPAVDPSALSLVFGGIGGSAVVTIADHLAKLAPQPGPYDYLVRTRREYRPTPRRRFRFR